MKETQRVTVSISTGTILRTVAILIGIGVAWLIRDIILYVFSAMLLAGVIYPFVHWGAKHKIPKVISVFALYLFMLTLLVFAFGLLVPAVLTEVRSLAGTYGDSWNWLRDSVSHVRDVSVQYGLAGNLQTSLDGIRTQITQNFAGLFSTVTDMFGSLAGIIIVLVLALYMILEESAIKDMVKQWIPEDHQAFASEVTWLIIKRLGSWLRGQLVLGVIIGLLYFVGLTAIGVPYALLIAIMAGLLEFIPYIGPIVSSIPAVVLALSISPARALITLILVIIIQQSEGHFIVPTVMRRTVGLNPIISIIAFMVGATLFGVVGAIFSIPLATAVSVFIQEYTRFRREASSPTV